VASWFCVSGPDFSRAAQNEKEIGLQPPAGSYPVRKTLSGDNSGPKKSAGAKASTQVRVNGVFPQPVPIGSPADSSQAVNSFFLFSSSSSASTC
jgi:hypothetical protein